MEHITGNDDLAWVAKNVKEWTWEPGEWAAKRKEIAIIERATFEYSADFGPSGQRHVDDLSSQPEGYEWDKAGRIEGENIERELDSIHIKLSEPEEWTSRIPAGSTHHSVDGGENDIFIKLDDGIFKMWRHDHWANVFGAFPFDLELVPQPTGAELLAKEREKVISEMYNVVKAKAGEEFTMSEAYGILYDEKYRLTEPK